MRGRKPTPTALKILAGNPGKRPLNSNEPRPAAAVPSCPRHLNTEARREWRRITQELAAVGLLTNLDRGALAAYCVAWARWCEAEQHLNTEGTVSKTPNGYPQQSPWLAVANKSIEQLSKLAAEFGLTPSSRTRLSVTDAGAGDELERFINEGASLRLAA